MQDLNLPEGTDVTGPAYDGSFQQLLTDNIGRMVKLEFLVGVSELVSQTGELYAVGYRYVITKRQNSYVASDLYAIKFATFY